MTRRAFTLCLLTLGLSVVSGPAAAQNNDDILPFPVTLFQLGNGLTLVGRHLRQPGHRRLLHDRADRFSE